MEEELTFTKKEAEWLVKKMVKTIDIRNEVENVEFFQKEQPFFYDDTQIFWFWDKEKSRWKIIDEIDIMNLLEGRFMFHGKTIEPRIKSKYLEAFKRIGRKNKPKESPSKWVQFRDRAINIYHGENHKVTPEYFFTNPIPWELGESTDTPKIDKLFEEWVGKEYVETLYEIIAYCCLTDYPIHTIFCLVGSGRNGKSRFIALLAKFLGIENICSTELDTLVSNRFESFKLYRKLLCCMGETNFGILNRTSILKKLCGQDLIGFEKKGKQGFDSVNYAKIMIASNSLPSSEDTSEGFYRRWLIVEFPNIFPEGKDILKSIPDEEYNNLAKKVSEILPKLLERASFKNQGTITERRNKYIMSSNPLPIFLRKCCEICDSKFVSYNHLYTAYIKFLNNHKKRRVKMKEFRSALESEGIWIEKTSKREGEEWKSGLWAMGVDLKDDWEDSALFDSTSTLSLYIGKVSENYGTNRTKGLNYDPINLKCWKCGLTPCASYDKNNQDKPICEFCIGDESQTAQEVIE